MNTGISIQTGTPGHRRRASVVGIVVVVFGLVLCPGRSALADDPYFIHIADPHVSALTFFRWEDLLYSILALSPAPDLVVCSGDLVDYGAGAAGGLNYDLLLNSVSINTTSPGVHYLDDGSHQIPIFFSPGNHDYRNVTQATEDLTNYKDDIHPNTYFHEIASGTFAIFSIDSGYDTFDDIYVDLPEGSGLAAADLQQLELDLDALDGVVGGDDTSSYKKIVFMHHPHMYPKDEMCSLDGAFVDNKSELIRICEDYGVDWLLFGHLHPDESMVFDLSCDTWTPAKGTKCVVGVSATDVGYRRESADGTGADVTLFQHAVPVVSSPGLIVTGLLMFTSGLAALAVGRRRAG